MTAYDIIRKPVVTEASMAATADRKYTFVVDKRANKTEIAKAIEKILRREGRKSDHYELRWQEKAHGRRPSRRRPDWKKAIVKLTEDSKTIELFEEMV